MACHGAVNYLNKDEPGGPGGRSPSRAFSFLLAVVAVGCAVLPAGMAVEIRSPAIIAYRDGGIEVFRAPMALNDDNDNGLNYTARRHWRCAEKCPDGRCDHRTHEPVWDYLYVGDKVEAEDDLLALELTVDASLPANAKVMLEVVSGGDSVRLWTDKHKGPKREILPNSGLTFNRAEFPRTVYLEGIKLGSAKLRLSAPGESFDLIVDVFRLVERMGGKRRLIYDPGEIVLSLEPAEALRSAAYRDRVVWSGDASGTGQQVKAILDPGDTAAMRRAVYRVKATVGEGLVFERRIRVRQKVYTGSPVARTTPERRKEVESLLEIPTHGMLPTALPNKRSVTYSQAWFESRYTGSSSPGDPVKPLNQARLQYAPNFDNRKKWWGVAVYYRNPYGAFITKLAYDAGLKREDLQGVAHHELRHLTHYMEMYNATGQWHVLCRDLDRGITTHFMEADASSASLQGGSSWRYLYQSAASVTKNYKNAVAEINKLPSLPQRTAAIKILHDLYKGIPRDMEEFKRADYECFIRPPLELDDR